MPNRLNKRTTRIEMKQFTGVFMQGKRQFKCDKCGELIFGCRFLREHKDKHHRI